MDFESRGTVRACGGGAICPLNRPLHDKTDIFLHHGFNNWNNAGKVQMQSAADGFFAATIDVPVTATVLDVVFSDGQVRSTMPTGLISTPPFATHRKSSKSPE